MDWIKHDPMTFFFSLTGIKTSNFLQGHEEMVCSLPFYQIPLLYFSWLFLSLLDNFISGFSKLKPDLGLDDNRKHEEENGKSETAKRRSQWKSWSKIQTWEERAESSDPQLTGWSSFPGTTWREQSGGVLTIKRIKSVGHYFTSHIGT